MKEAKNAAFIHNRPSDHSALQVRFYSASAHLRPLVGSSASDKLDEKLFNSATQSSINRLNRCSNRLCQFS